MVDRRKVMSFRVRAQQLDRAEGTLAETAVLDLGVQDTGPDGGRWALAVRGVDVDGAAVGVVARMDAIGVRVDEVVERVSLRAATAVEVDALHLPARTFVHTIERTYLAGGVPVETADIVLPGGRYDLVYRIPID